MSTLLLILLLAVPPMDAANRALAEQTTDHAGFDEAGLYALLADALTWREGDEAGAAVPDYAALLDTPAAHRGDLCLLEGRFAGRARRVNLARSGAYGDAVTEWVILTSDDPAGGDVAVIFFVDPDHTLPVPEKGQHVRTVGRFYKVWSDADAHGNATDYLLFVARHPTLIAMPGQGMSRGGTLMTAVLVLVVLGVPLMMVLRRIAVKPIEPRRLARRGVEEVAEEMEEHLPVDSADALEALSRRHE